MGLDSVCQRRDLMQQEGELEERKKKRNETKRNEKKTIDHVGAFGPGLELAHVGVEIVRLTRIGDIIGTLAAQDLFAVADDGE